MLLNMHIDGLWVLCDAAGEATAGCLYMRGKLGVRSRLGKGEVTSSKQWKPMGSVEVHMKVAEEISGVLGWGNKICGVSRRSHHSKITANFCSSGCKQSSTFDK